MFPSSTGKPQVVAIGILDRTLTTNQGTEDLEYKPNVGELGENYLPVYTVHVCQKCLSSAFQWFIIYSLIR